MAKQLRKKALLICLGLVFLAAIGVFPKSLARAKQNRTNLHIEVTGLKRVNGRDQAAGVAGANVLVKALATDQEFEETSATNSQGVANVADVPYGTTLVQVTAQGWKNSGNRYELNRRDQTIQIQLKEAEEAAPSPSPTPSGSPLSHRALRHEYTRPKKSILALGTRAPSPAMSAKRETVAGSRN
jgi:hypothetical protein